jgi:isochorismate hydrolase
VPEPTPSTEPAPQEVPPVAPPAAVSAEDLQAIALIADLQRFGALQPEDARREVNAMTVTLTRQRTDANRVRLAVLYTIAKSNPQDDLRALQLLENVAKSGPGSGAVKQLAAILHAQISERVRAVREEQARTDAATQKLEALRNMERSLLRERMRGGAGGGSGSGGGGGGGGGGSGN